MESKSTQGKQLKDLEIFWFKKVYEFKWINPVLTKDISESLLLNRHFHR